MLKIRVIEIKLKVYLLQDIFTADTLQHIGKLIDSALIDGDMQDFHYATQTKMYCFSNLYPLAKNKIYSAGGVYTITIRTADNRVAEALNRNLDKQYNQYFKALTIENRVLTQKPIERIYTLTPMIIKFKEDENTYWRDNHTLEEFEEAVRVNLIKKYNKIMNTKIDEDIELFQGIQLDNQTPTVIAYKGVKLLGDKITINIANSEISNEIAWIAIATGIGTASARGAGFCNYRYL